MSSSKPWLDYLGRHASQIFLVTVSIVAVVYLVTEHAEEMKEKMILLLEYIEENKAAGSIIYVLTFGVTSCLLIPISFMTMAAGVIFRPVIIAIALVLAGTQLGLFLSVLLGRTVLRPWVESRVKDDVTLSAVDRAISKEGAKLVILLRLSPIAPFGIANYILSATSISYPLLAGATLVGNLPGAVAGCVVGSFLGSLSGAGEYKLSPRAQCLGLLFAGAFAVNSVVYVGLVARKACISEEAVTLLGGTSSGNSIEEEFWFLGDFSRNLQAADSKRPPRSQEQSHDSYWRQHGSLLLTVLATAAAVVTALPVILIFT
ncbi:snare associated Golgi protein-domain-containing protein [Zopfochytrium polystomum]|nr:snare associated Golgi protein-domain-containing protein [Zopfochytrium polystomum]